MFGLPSPRKRLTPRKTIPHLAVAAALALACVAAPMTPALANAVLKVTPAAEARVVELDLDTLRRMPSETITTTTIWTEGEIAFTGVSLKTLVLEMGLTTAEMSFVALNDYAVTIPLSDAVENGPIIAYEMDGKPMSVRDKGPLWVIYPFDSNPEYQAEKYYSRSIWQLHRVEAVN
ncbi:molybdopterin-dependent oxidoreductase [Thalassobius sp. MITS945101]|uniref:molybdopterin-dependent oxidoreductase n=1 Tax=Thalassobius sp. MITS945101 TaxID=3096994 RepID=UPI00399A1CD0